MSAWQRVKFVWATPASPPDRPKPSKDTSARADPLYSGGPCVLQAGSDVSTSVERPSVPFSVSGFVVEYLAAALG